MTKEQMALIRQFRAAAYDAFFGAFQECHIEYVLNRYMITEASIKEHALETYITHLENHLDRFLDAFLANDILKAALNENSIQMLADAAAHGAISAYYKSHKETPSLVGPSDPTAKILKSMHAYTSAFFEGYIARRGEDRDYKTAIRDTREFMAGMLRQPNAFSIKLI